MKIYTLTLSPAYDVHARCGEFAAGRENLAEITSREAGGKGINISRALLAIGVESTPIVLVGEENSEEFEAALERDGLKPLIIRTSGRIRENLTLHSKDGETRISYKGPVAPKELVSILKSSINPHPCDVLTLTGRLPEGISPEDLLPLLTELRESGVRIVLDSHSYSSEDVRQARPWLIKPNREEIYEYLGIRINSLEDAIRHKDKILLLGAENALVTLDRDGAVLIGADDAISLHAPEVCAISSIGAGDAAVSGFIWAHTLGEVKKDALARAVAFGCAAVLTKGTEPPRREDIIRLFNKII